MRLNFSKALDWIKLPPKYLLALALAMGSLLFGSAGFIECLGLGKIIEEYRGWTGTVFVVVTALLIAHFANGCFRMAVKEINRRRGLYWSRKRLHDLTPQEKRILRGYVYQNTRSQNLSFEDGVVKGLEHLRVIYRAANVGDFITGIAYNIQPWAWTYLNEHPELLED